MSDSESYTRLATSDRAEPELGIDCSLELELEPAPELGALAKVVSAKVVADRVRSRVRTRTLLRFVSDDGEMTQDQSGKLPLHWLCAAKDLTPEQLGEAAAATDLEDWTTKDQDGRTPLLVLCGGSALSETMLDALDSELPDFGSLWSATTRKGYTPLMKCCESKGLRAGLLTRATRLCGTSAWHVRTDADDAKNSGYTALHNLALGKSGQLTPKILQEATALAGGKQAWAAQGKDERTPLHRLCASRACTVDLLATATELAGSDVWATVDKNGHTPLHVLCKCSVENGAVLVRAAVKWTGPTALVMATAKGRTILQNAQRAEASAEPDRRKQTMGKLQRARDEGSGLTPLRILGQRDPSSLQAVIDAGWLMEADRLRPTFFPFWAPAADAILTDRLYEQRELRANAADSDHDRTHILEAEVAAARERVLEERELFEDPLACAISLRLKAQVDSLVAILIGKRESGIGHGPMQSRQHGVFTVRWLQQSFDGLLRWGYIDPILSLLHAGLYTVPTGDVETLWLDCWSAGFGGTELCPVQYKDFAPNKGSEALQDSIVRLKEEAEEEDLNTGPTPRGIVVNAERDLNVTKRVKIRFDADGTVSDWLDASAIELMFPTPVWEHMITVGTNTDSHKWNVEPIVVAIDGAAHCGRDGLLYLLLNAGAEHRATVRLMCGCPVVQELIRFKWDAYGRRMFAWESALRFLLVCAWTFVTLYVVQREPFGNVVHPGKSLAAFVLCVCAGMAISQGHHSQIVFGSYLLSLPISVTLIGISTVLLASEMGAVHEINDLPAALGVSLLTTLASQILCEEMRGLHQIYLHARSPLASVWQYCEVWNVLDAGSVAVAFTTVIRTLFGMETNFTRQVSVVGTIMLWIRVIGVLRGYERTGPVRPPAPPPLSCSQAGHPRSS
eukprot:COSAG06_NODE_573_length_14086_cov_30.835633_8_plen_906_part_00